MKKIVILIYEIFIFYFKDKSIFKTSQYANLELQLNQVDISINCFKYVYIRIEIHFGTIINQFSLAVPSFKVEVLNYLTERLVNCYTEVKFSEEWKHDAKIKR